MGRAGWAAIVALLVGLIAYLAWPDPAPPPSERLVPAAFAPTSWRLRSGDLRQEIDGEAVRVNGLARVLDHNRAQRLLAGLRSVVATPEKTRRANAAELAAFGIDASQRELIAEGVRLSWGSSGTDSDRSFFIADLVTGRVFPLTQRQLAEVAFLDTRLDDLRLLPSALFAADAVRRIELRTDPGSAAGIAGLTVVAPGESGGSPTRWSAPAAPDRPGFGPRVRALLALLREVPLRDLTPSAATSAAEPARYLAQLTITYDDRGTTRTVSARLAGDDALAVDGLPSQRLERASAEAIAAACAAFARDEPFDLPTAVVPSPVGLVQVARDGIELFRLERDGRDDARDGRTAWSLVWPGGREDAPPDVGNRFLAAFAALAISNPQPLPADGRHPAGATLITLGGDPGLARLALDGAIAEANGFRGRWLRLPPPLDDLVAERFLDVRPLPVEPERIVKFQRVIAAGTAGSATAGVAETYVRQGSAWSRSAPRSGPVSGPAVARLIAALCGLYAAQSRPANDLDRSSAAAAPITLAVRVAALPAGKAANDDRRIEDTAQRDAAFALWKATDAAGGYWLLPQLGSICYRIDDEAVALLCLASEDLTLLPVAANRIARVSLFRREAGVRSAFTLERTAQGFELIHATTATAAISASSASLQAGEGVAIVAADRVEVRRWLRDLTAQSAERHDAAAGALAPDEVQASLIIELGLGEDAERLSLLIGAAGADSVPVSVQSSLGSASVLPGRMWISPAQRALLCPDPQRLANAASTRPGSP